MKMNFLHMVSAHILCCLLLVGVTGCDWLSKSASPQPLTEESKNSLESKHERLLTKRKTEEEKFLGAMELYRTKYNEVRIQRAQLKEYLKGKSSGAEAIALFSKSQPNEIPSNLRLAYSCWRTLLPDLTQCEKIITWLDQQQASGYLENFDFKIKTIENAIQLGKFLDKTNEREIDRLLSTPLNDWDSVADVNEAFYEQQAIEKLKVELTSLGL